MNHKNLELYDFTSKVSDHSTRAVVTVQFHCQSQQEKLLSNYQSELCLWGYLSYDIVTIKKKR